MAKRIPPSPTPPTKREATDEGTQHEPFETHALTHEDGDAETSGAQSDASSDSPSGSPSGSHYASQTSEGAQPHEARQSVARDAQITQAQAQCDPAWLGASAPKSGKAKDSAGGHGYAPAIAHGEESGYGPADASPGEHPRFGRQSSYGPHDDYAGTGRDASGTVPPVRSASQTRHVDWPAGTVGAESGEDATVRDNVRSAFSKALDLDVSHVGVTVTSGLVLLTGYVPERWMQHVVQTVVAKVPGVKGVDNKLHERREKAMSRPGESQEGHKI